MDFTVREGFENGKVIISSKNEKFISNWGDYISVSKSKLFEQMTYLADWCNNTVGAECLFEME